MAADCTMRHGLATAQGAEHSLSVQRLEGMLENRHKVRWQFGSRPDQVQCVQPLIALLKAASVLCGIM